MATKRKSKMPKIKWSDDKRIGHLADIYKAKDGWRWRLWAKNGRIVAESGEAYRAKSRCVNMLDRLGMGFFAMLTINGVVGKR